MDIWQIDKLVLFLIFFIPGFISIKVYDLLVPSERRDFSKALFDAIGYSCLNFAALFWLIILIHSGDFYVRHKTLYLMVLFFIVFVSPALWSFLFVRFLSWRPFSKCGVNLIQKPWDFVFRSDESSWVIVHLADGRKLGGRFDTDSFASSYPSEEQIYLEEVWELDENGRFLKPIERSKGVIILGKEILAVEFFE